MLAPTAAVLAGECFVVGAVGEGCEPLAEAERLIVLDVWDTKSSHFRCSTASPGTASDDPIARREKRAYSRMVAGGGGYAAWPRRNPEPVDPSGSLMRFPPCRDTLDFRCRVVKFARRYGNNITQALSDF